MIIAIILIFAGILLTGAMVVSNTIGTRVLNYLRGAGYIAAGAINHIPWRSIPWNQIREALRNAIQRIPRWLAWIIRIIIAIMLLLYIVFFAIIVGIASAMGSPGTGILIGILFLALMLFMFLRRVPGYRNVGWILTIIVSILLISISGNLVFGWWSPESKVSAGRLSKNFKQAVANYMDKKSIQSEAESGIICITNRKTGLYDDGKNFIKSVSENSRIMTINLEGKKVNEKGQGMTFVMLENENGDFVKGELGWMPSSDINFHQNKAAPSLPAPEKWEDAKEMVNLSNLYDNVDHNWQCEELNPGPGQYRSVASGNYMQHFLDTNGKEYDVEFDPDGRMVNRGGKKWINPPYNDRLPVQGMPVGSLVARIGNRKPFLLGSRGSFTITSEKENKVCFSRNMPQDYANTGENEPSKNFVGNRGESKIKLEKRVQ